MGPFALTKSSLRRYSLKKEEQPCHHQNVLTALIFPALRTKSLTTALKLTFSLDFTIILLRFYVTIST